MGINFLVKNDYWGKNKKYYLSIVKKNNIKVVLYSDDNYKIMLENELDIVEKDKTKLEEKRENFLFVLEETGVLAFNLACKRKKIVCATMDNEHFAFMTRLHNNTNVVVFNHYSLSTKGIVNCMNIFLGSQYEGGRHKVRLDMLEKEID